MHGIRKCEEGNSVILRAGELSESAQTGTRPTQSTCPEFRQPLYSKPCSKQPALGLYSGNGTHIRIPNRSRSSARINSTSGNRGVMTHS